MKLQVQPEGSDRVVSVRHTGWGLEWRLQFPETIVTAEGEFMAWPANCRPDWEAMGDGGWGYTWRPWPGYGKAVRAMDHLDSQGNPQHREFVEGLALRAEIRPLGAGLILVLILSNESEKAIESVHCDGGCWQAWNSEFAGDREVARSHVMVDSRMTSMAKIGRSVSVRCMYQNDPARYDGQEEWFWGRCEEAIDQPAIVGMQARRGRRALVFGYEGADSALANADEHHCLHSRPLFGTLRPGQSVGRRGYILFGQDIKELAEKLLELIQTGSKAK